MKINYVLKILQDKILVTAISFEIIIEIKRGKNESFTLTKRNFF